MPSQTAGKISAAEVIEAIEGPLSLTNCVSDEGLCGQFEKCNVKSPLQRLNEIVAQTFRDLTIEKSVGGKASASEPAIWWSRGWSCISGPSGSTV